VVVLDKDIQRTLLRVAQEALTNAQNHAQARRVVLTLTNTREAVVLGVEDDGVGFDVGEVLDRAPAQGRYGLVGMRERAESIGGSLDVDSEPRRGTRIELTVPLLKVKEGVGAGDAHQAKLVSTAAAEVQAILAAEVESQGTEDERDKSRSVFHKLPALFKR